MTPLIARPADLAGRVPRLPRIVAVALLAALAPAAPADPVPDELRVCVSEKDDTRRLACYDAAVARLRGGQPSPAAAPAAAGASTVPAAVPAAAAAVPATRSGAPSAPPSAGDPEDEFGRRGDLRREQQVGPDEVTSAVVSLARSPDGRFTVTLENRQVWREIAPNASVRLEPGDTVRIERGALGSFVLVAPNKRSSKVTRIR